MAAAGVWQFVHALPSLDKFYSLMSSLFLIPSSFKMPACPFTYFCLKRRLEHKYSFMEVYYLLFLWKHSKGHCCNNNIIKMNQYACFLVDIVKLPLCCCYSAAAPPESGCNYVGVTLYDPSPHLYLQLLFLNVGKTLPTGPSITRSQGLRSMAHLRHLSEEAERRRPRPLIGSRPSPWLPLQHPWPTPHSPDPLPLVDWKGITRGGRSSAFCLAEMEWRLRRANSITFDSKGTSECETRMW